MDRTAVNSGEDSSLSGQRSLRGFWMLTITQFQGAFSDNALRWLIGFLVLQAGLPRERRDFLFVLVVPLLFSLPFIFFSIPGGYFADRHSKRTITVRTKFLELGIMGYAAWALAGGHLIYAGVALFLVCSQAAIFGPTKYGLLPELLPLRRLSWGNGIIELTTFLAAILGTLAGGLLAHHFAGRQLYSGMLLIALSVAGIASSLGIPRLRAADPYREFSWNWAGNLLRVVRAMGRDRFLITAVTANTFFWFLASLLLLNIVLFSTDVLRVDEVHSSYLLAGLSLGIGVGSFAAGYAARERIAHGMILPAMMAISGLSLLLAWPGLGFAAVLWLLVALGVSAGFFAVPVNALIQARPAREEKGRMIAAANLLSFVGIALQPVAQYGMLRLGHPAPGHVFVIAAGITVVMAGVLWGMLPELGR
ncbi:MAG: MFS transporter [Acidobacteriia bacterium]|nr:MFS transporter [Terriglobia bacterium]